jgi:hypothetical protein
MLFLIVRSLFADTRSCPPRFLPVFSRCVVYKHLLCFFLLLLLLLLLLLFHIYLWFSSFFFTFSRCFCQSFEVTVYLDTDKFSSNVCYEDPRRHEQHLFSSSNNNNSPRNSSNNINNNNNKWQLRMDELTIDETNMLGQVFNCCWLRFWCFDLLIVITGRVWCCVQGQLSRKRSGSQEDVGRFDGRSRFGHF